MRAVATHNRAAMVGRALSLPLQSRRQLASQANSTSAGGAYHAHNGGRREKQKSFRQAPS